MAIPERITPTKLDDYLEVMAKAIFQAGMRWAVIEAKWSAFQKAFSGFDTRVVAGFTSKDVERLANDPSIIRSPSKIAAVSENARTMLSLDKQYNGFTNYLRSFDSYEQLVADMRRKFKYMGELNVYYLLFRVGEPVPNFEDWVKTIPGDHPRMREMVELARAQDEQRRAG